MITLDLHGPVADLWAGLEHYVPEVRARLAHIHDGMEHYPKREIRDYEAALLYVMAQQYNQPGANFVEIGTCWGWSAAVMAAAAPQASITTCTPNPNHVKIARRNLARYPQVQVVEARSVELLPEFADNCLALVFVDGDHKAVRDDLPWYNKLMEGGLKIHHDYCPPDTPVRPCRWVWDALNDFGARMHAPDVLLVDADREGMAGWYRRAGEVWA